jgi:hypothetical protein
VTPGGPDAPEVGLCARCAHAAVQRSSRGSTFWRCRRADSDPAFRRYPPLPVLRCPGFEGGGKLAAVDGAAPQAGGREPIAVRLPEGERAAAADAREGTGAERSERGGR